MERTNQLLEKEMEWEFVEEEYFQNADHPVCSSNCTLDIMELTSELKTNKTTITEPTNIAIKQVSTTDDFRTKNTLATLDLEKQLNDSSNSSTQSFNASSSSLKSNALCFEKTDQHGNPNPKLNVGEPLSPQSHSTFLRDRSPGPLSPFASAKGIAINLSPVSLPGSPVSLPGSFSSSVCSNSFVLSDKLICKDDHRFYCQSVKSKCSPTPIMRNRLRTQLGLNDPSSPTGLAKRSSSFQAGFTSPLGGKRNDFSFNHNSISSAESTNFESIQNRQFSLQRAPSALEARSVLDKPQPTQVKIESDFNESFGEMIAGFQQRQSEQMQDLKYRNPQTFQNRLTMDGHWCLEEMTIMTGSDFYHCPSKDARFLCSPDILQNQMINEEKEKEEEEEEEEESKEARETHALLSGFYQQEQSSNTRSNSSVTLLSRCNSSCLSKNSMLGIGSESKIGACANLLRPYVNSLPLEIKSGNVVALNQKPMRKEEETSSVFQSPLLSSYTWVWANQATEVHCKHAGYHIQNKWMVRNTGLRDWSSNQVELRWVGGSLKPKEKSYWQRFRSWICPAKCVYSFCSLPLLSLINNNNNNNASEMNSSHVSGWPSYDQSSCSFAPLSSTNTTLCSLPPLRSNEACVIEFSVKIPSLDGSLLFSLFDVSQNQTFGNIFSFLPMLSLSRVLDNGDRDNSTNLTQFSSGNQHLGRVHAGCNAQFVEEIPQQKFSNSYFDWDKQPFRISLPMQMME